MKFVDMLPVVIVVGIFATLVLYLVSQNPIVRQGVGRLTSPIFVPLRRLVVWGDDKFGTCDMKLSIEPRKENVLDGFADIDTPAEPASELMKKVSKDKANLTNLGKEADFRDTLSYTGATDE